MDRQLENKIIEITYFNNQDYETLKTNSLDNFKKKENYNCWINIRDNDFSSYIDILKKEFEIHNLVLEDIKEGSKRTKIEQFDNFKFITSHPVKEDNLIDKLVEYDDAYIILMENLIITFNNSKNDIFHNLIEKMYTNKGKIDNTINKLNFAIMKSIVNNYYTNLEEIENEVNRVELKLMKKNDYDVIDELYLLRRNIIYMNKNITPFKSIVKYMHESIDTNIVRDVTYYYRDLVDDIDSIIERIEVYRELTTNLIDIINSKLSNKANQITTILTVWSTIFLPITFLTGVYGMNFRYMSSLESELGYPIFWLISVIIVVVMIVFFKKKKWF
ncbi:magnesium/cobalt transporter CorA [Peptostreptococcaceae bacterium OttesenSCG-928-C18]|nr:magnesium/cobalt transporter CorA [Peptostreptococcaceae bacterium OttesenSCG-928-C18]